MPGPLRGGPGAPAPRGALASKPPDGVDAIPMQSRQDGRSRISLRPGIRVRVVRKEDQRTEKLTEGVVRDILTRSQDHPHGIKVRLEDGTVGRVKEILG